ncbi:CLUMA_CG017279, isoform A [Clunio marinus]|uniref:CLUMA_CG017279, isoform A n=1 Tax=Clunio marinus TaxID=568069 RepID=A0A1J1IV81_9DIPT|nr:CLUMA_CG017279, isoform A [Clunio marinus]
MRNCFVPGCDAYCKKNQITQRKMFLAPAKLLSKWKEILPKKREFKQHDRVCERHFEDTDIIQFWESKINGQIHFTPRDKPKLRSDAIPCKNFPINEELISEIVEIPTKQKKQKVTIHSQVVKSKRKVKDSSEDIQITKKIKNETEEKFQEVEDISVLTDCVIDDENKALEDSVVIKVTIDPKKWKAMVEAFENLYDEAFDVTLPSLLWGIHRDPERSFIAFSEFNPSLMQSSKTLYIDNNFNCSTYISNKKTSEKALDLEHLTSDHITTMLDEIDKQTLIS